MPLKEITSTPANPPEGNVTFLFTDLVGSSQIAKKLPYRDYEGKLLDPKFALFSDLIIQHNGYEVGTPSGDSVMAAFASVRDALDCAVEMQVEISKIKYVDPAGVSWILTIRIGVHRSVQYVPLTTRGLYLSHPEVNFAARVMALAHARQIVVSESAYDAAGIRRERFKPFPNRRIKDGSQKPVTIYELIYDGVEREEPGSQFVPGWFREDNYYVARPELENRVADIFQRRTPNNAPYRLVTLHGFGGMGKTRLGIQCCLNVAERFEGRLFRARMDGIPDGAMTDDENRRDYLAVCLARAFNLSEASANYRALPVQLPSTGPMLLLLDNYETVRGKASTAFLEQILNVRPTLSILVTGREAVGLQFEVLINVAGLQETEGRELFITRVREKLAQFGWKPSETEEESISSVLKETECIPLALELVAAHSGEMTLHEIASDLAKTPMGAMTETPLGSFRNDPSGRHETLEKCYDWSWRRLDAIAQQTLVIVSLFADRCPWEEISACFPSIQREHLGRLQQAALMYREQLNGQSVYSLLRLTRAYARKHLRDIDPDGTLQSTFITFYLKIVIDNGGRDNLADDAKRSQLERIWRNALAAANIAETLHDNVSLATFADQLFHFIDRQDYWAEARSLFEKALAYREKTLIPIHMDIATSLDHLARFYYREGNFVAATEYATRTLEIRKKQLSSINPIIAISLNDLGAIKAEQRYYPEAISLFRKALSLQKKTIGRLDTDYTQSLNNIAFVYEQMNKFKRAENLYLYALAIRKKSFIKEDTDLATILNNLAYLYVRQGKYTEAEPLFRSALDIRTAAFHEDHRDVVTVINNLGDLYLRQENYSAAEFLYKRAVEVRERTLPENHPDKALSLSNLAVLYEKQGKYNEAKPLMERALHIFENVMPDAPYTQLAREFYEKLERRIVDNKVLGDVRNGESF